MRAKNLNGVWERVAYKANVNTYAFKRFSNNMGYGSGQGFIYWTVKSWLGVEEYTEIENFTAWNVKKGVIGDYSNGLKIIRPVLISDETKFTTAGQRRRNPGLGDTRKVGQKAFHNNSSVSHVNYIEPYVEGFRVGLGLEGATEGNFVSVSGSEEYIQNRANYWVDIDVEFENGKAKKPKPGDKLISLPVLSPEEVEARLRAEREAKERAEREAKERAEKARWKEAAQKAYRTKVEAMRALMEAKRARREAWQAKQHGG